MLLFVKRITILPLAWLYFAGSQACAEEPLYGPESVVVVANKAMPGSLKVARAYMKMRGVEDSHLILLETPVQEHVNRKEYLESIHNPLISELLRRKLVDAFEGSVDSLGRKTTTIYSNNIRYLVLCYGIPSKIRSTSAEEAKLDEPYLRDGFSRTNPQLLENFLEGHFAKNEASVDGELALLFKRNMPLRGFIPNPLQKNPDRSAYPDILRVTRLDGPSPESVLRMLESALAGERYGLRGRAYVDEDGRKGGFEVGNTWMANTASLFQSLGFDTSHNTAHATIAQADRFDAPVLYAGWYAGHCEGPFVLPGFRFPDGAVAAHLHSASAAQIRSASNGWVGPFVERGVACTFGNVSEPYLLLTHYFDSFFIALSQGWNFADAAYFALPGLSWQAVAVGDPLYRPFAVSLDQQLDASGDPLSVLQDQYVLIRKANLLEQAGKPDEARQLIAGGMGKSPGPALIFRNALFLEAMGETAMARDALALAGELPLSDPTMWGLYAEMADALANLGDADSSLLIYKKLLAADLPEKAYLAFHERGAKVAELAGNAELAIKWKTRSIQPPPASSNN